MAEKGPVDKSNGTFFDTSVPIDMRVDVKFADQDYTVSLADLITENVIPSTVTATDTGATSLTIPRRVPHRWEAKLTIDDTTYPDHVLRPGDVPPEPTKHFAGTDKDVDDASVNPSLSRQPSQAYTFGFSSATTTGTKFKVGGKNIETVVAEQAYPQTKAHQPQGVTGLVKPSAPLVHPTFLATPVSIADFFIPETTTTKATQKKRKLAFDQREGHGLDVPLQLREGPPLLHAADGSTGLQEDPEQQAGQEAQEGQRRDQATGGGRQHHRSL